MEVYFPASYRGVPDETKRAVAGRPSYRHINAMVLKEVSGNAQPRHLNPYECAQIVTLHDTDLSELSIQKFIDEKYLLKCSLATIHNTISLDPERIQRHTLQLG